MYCKLTRQGARPATKLQTVKPCIRYKFYRAGTTGKPQKCATMKDRYRHANTDTHKTVMARNATMRKFLFLGWWERGGGGGEGHDRQEKIHVLTFAYLT
jgi:hypothetical protein